MNYTAKKLREAANYMKREGVASVVGDIRNTFAAIADELDKLQMKANEANNLRQRLESVEDKAERRKKHIGYLNTALHDKNAVLKRRGEAIARVTAENADLRKQVPSEREREILDMWPKFEDGEPVMIGDGFMGCGGVNDVVELLDFEDDNVRLWGESGCDIDLGLKPVVKRPARSVLDADGVEIHVGDTVWHHSGFAHGVVTSIDAGSLMGTVRYVNGGVEFRDAAKDLTHTRPDSWERLESDAVKGVCEYTGAEPTAFGAHDCDTCRFYGEHGKLICEQLMALDIVRRAKALAGVEVD